MFNPHATITSLPVGDAARCWVVDDALVDPQAWVARAAAMREAFALTAHNAYPGPELALPEAIAERLAAFFAAHVKEHLQARRIQRAHARLAMVTLPPERLQPRQWICHRDHMGLGPGHVVGASVLYLFADQRLGGTSFWRARRPMAEIDRLVLDSGALAADEFSARYGIAPGYIGASNDWFELLTVVPPRFNRLILYDGNLFHCSHIEHPELLSEDPAHGRLTLNGFFHCTRRAT